MEDMYLTICDWDNIHNAYLKARKCKRYKDEILRFSYNIENNLLNIHYDLLNEKYIHGKYYEFMVSDSKKRIIRAAPFKDRIIHHCLCKVIEPMFDKFFIFDTYACRKSKGLHAAIKRFKDFLRIIKLKNGLDSYDNIYCLKCDIVKYFDSVDQEILFSLIKRRITDGKVLKLIKIILKSYPKGIPIGNLTSQLFANIYLHEMDFYIKNTLKCKYYIRYMDDFILLGLEKTKLWEQYNLIKEFLNRNLKLKIDDKKTQLMPIKKGIVFLGFVIFLNKLLLRKSTIKRFQKRIKKQIEYHGSNQEKIMFLAQQFVYWRPYYSKADTWVFVKRLFCRVGEKYDKDIWEWGNTT